MSKETLKTSASGAVGKPSDAAAGKLLGNKSLSQEQCAEQNMVAMERFASAFEKSARRWEMVVYPAMIVFTLLASYGFYQIYAVTRDMRLMASQIEPQLGIHMTRLTLSMQQLTDNISQMSQNIHKMQKNVAVMSGDVNSMTNGVNNMSGQMTNLSSMNVQMTAMNRSMENMAANTNMMRWDMAKLNRSIGKPMNFMNSFMPW